MPALVRTRLSVMMLVFYASLGTWAVTASTYLKAPAEEGGLQLSHAQVGWIYSTFAIGGILANPLVGLLVDRLFRAERVFGVAGIVSGLILFGAGFWCDASLVNLRHSTNPAELNAAVFGWLFVIMICYSFALQIAMPLATVLSLRNLRDPAHQFSRTRMFGTVGWVIIGLLLPNLVTVISAQPFYLAGALMLVAGVYGFTLPATPPKGTGKGLAEAFGVPALALFRKRSFVVYISVAFVLSVTNQFYGVHGHPFLTERGFDHPERWMTIGQCLEVGCMFIIPLLKPAQTMKWLMLAGAVGGALRGVALAWGPDWLILGLGVPMHGWQFAFYFIVAATYIDREAPAHLRGSTQAIAAFVGGGLGPLVGNMFASRVLSSGAGWTTFWIWPMGICALAAVAFAVFFRTPVRGTSPLIVPTRPQVDEYIETEIPAQQA